MGKRSAVSSMKGTEGGGDLIEIFADGACSGNPGPGGYGAILRYRDMEKEISGGEKQTTNNRMELTAVIEALRQIKRPSRVRVMTDSTYVVKGMSEWLPQWIRRNWVGAGKKPVLNRDLWESLMAASLPHKVEWMWIRGHAGHAENERCDLLAREAIRRSRTAGGAGNGLE
jgi:ribonuclease HI